MKKFLIIFDSIAGVIILFVVLIFIFSGIENKTSNEINNIFNEKKHSENLLFSSGYSIGYKYERIDTYYELLWADDNQMVYSYGSKIIYVSSNNKKELTDINLSTYNKIFLKDNKMYYMDSNIYYSYDIDTTTKEELNKDTYLKIRDGDYLISGSIYDSSGLIIYNNKTKLSNHIRYNDILGNESIKEFSNLTVDYVGYHIFENIVLIDLLIDNRFGVVFNYNFTNNKLEFYDWTDCVSENNYKYFYISKNVSYPILGMFNF